MRFVFAIVFFAACQPPPRQAPQPSQTQSEEEDCGDECLDIEAPTGPSGVQPQCSADAECASLACCSGQCARLVDSDQHCGACGHKCTLRQFCSAATCTPLVLANTCTMDRADVVLDGNSDDDAASSQIAIAWQNA